MPAMDEKRVEEHWNANARAWTALTRAGCDRYRDHLNLPAFLDLLPDVRDRVGIDVGCGEGHCTRRIAERGARMVGVDLSEAFVAAAGEAEAREPLGIAYCRASAARLPFGSGSLDFATAIMSLMDMPEPGKALSEAHRVLRPGGFLQFSLSHPCFETPHRRNLRDGAGRTYAREVGGYFEPRDGEIDEWTFGSATAEQRARYPKFRIPRFTRTLGEWIDLVLGAGFAVERLREPCPDAALVAERPELQDASVVAYFLHVLARKPA